MIVALFVCFKNNPSQNNVCVASTCDLRFAITERRTPHWPTGHWTCRCQSAIAHCPLPYCTVRRTTNPLRFVRLCLCPVLRLPHLRRLAFRPPSSVTPCRLPSLVFKNLVANGPWTENKQYERSKQESKSTSSTQQFLKVTKYVS